MVVENITYHVTGTSRDMAGMVNRRKANAGAKSSSPQTTPTSPVPKEDPHQGQRSCHLPKLQVNETNYSVRQFYPTKFFGAKKFITKFYNTRACLFQVLQTCMVYINLSDFRKSTTCLSSWRCTKRKERR